MCPPRWFRPFTMCFACWGIVSLFVITATAAGQKSSNRYRTYARRIIQQSDSAMLFNSEYTNVLMRALKRVTDSSSDFDSQSAAYTKLAETAALYSAEIRRKTGDFDAMNPPTGYERVHSQMVQPLKAMERNVDQLAQTFAYASCAQESQTGIGCEQSQRIGKAMKVLMSIVGQQVQALMDYKEARDRVGGLLAEHGIKLPDMK